jgi:hypothetical protein
MPGVPQLIVERGFAHQWWDGGRWTGPKHGLGSLDHAVYASKAVSDPLTDLDTRNEMLAGLGESLKAENPEGEGSHYAVIDGVRVGLGTNNIIIFSTDWEHLWKLAAKGDHRLVKRSGGPETMGHTDLFYVGRDVKAYPSYEENPNGVVRVTADEVSNFKHSWPVSGLPDGYDFYFDFDSRGDLVDLWAQPEGTKYAPIGRNHKDTTRWDGDALVALSQDAQ